MILKFVTLMSLGMMLAGCPKPTELCRPLIVPPPKPPAGAFIRPELEIAKLPPNATDSEIIRAYVLTTVTLKDRCIYLEDLLRGYK